MPVWGLTDKTTHVHTHRGRHAPRWVSRTGEQPPAALRRLRYVLFPFVIHFLSSSEEKKNREKPPIFTLSVSRRICASAEDKQLSAVRERKAEPPRHACLSVCVCGIFQILFLLSLFLHKPKPVKFSQQRLVHSSRDGVREGNGRHFPMNRRDVVS